MLAMFSPVACQDPSPRSSSDTGGNSVSGPLSGFVVDRARRNCEATSCEAVKHVSLGHAVGIRKCTQSAESTVDSQVGTGDKGGVLAR